MTSRERVRKAVSFEEPDRVPIDLGGMKASGISAITYDLLKKRLGLRTPTRILDPRFMIAVVEEEILSRFHVDVLPVDLSGIQGQAAGKWVPRTLFDGTPVLFPPGTSIREDADGGSTLMNADGSASVFRMPRDGYYFDDTSTNHGDGIDPMKFRPQSDIPDESLRPMGDYAHRLYRDTRSTLSWGGGSACVSSGSASSRTAQTT